MMVIKVGKGFSPTPIPVGEDARPGPTPVGRNVFPGPIRVGKDYRPRLIPASPVGSSRSAKASQSEQVIRFRRRRSPLPQQIRRVKHPTDELEQSTQSTSSSATTVKMLPAADSNIMVSPFMRPARTGASVLGPMTGPTGSFPAGGTGEEEAAGTGEEESVEMTAPSSKVGTIAVLAALAASVYLVTR